MEIDFGFELKKTRGALHQLQVTFSVSINIFNSFLQYAFKVQYIIAFVSNLKNLIRENLLSWIHLVRRLGWF